METLNQQLIRLEKLSFLQEEYRSFVEFLVDGMEDMGFSVSEIQRDIASFLQYGPPRLMVQAQRSQAKTTITAFFAVWTLIQHPGSKVVIVSAAENLASDIATMIMRIINTNPMLECMRPDPSLGDRVSVMGFDIHQSLRPVHQDKSPSVSCVGIFGTLEGKRATLLIPDDIESTKNSQTQVMVQQLMEKTRAIESLVEVGGRVVYLGTPQSVESIYNSLPARGYTVRIWPGRYPTPAQMHNYSSNLAPMITTAIELNPHLQEGGGALKDQGQAVDERLDEAFQQLKELSTGPAYYQLQFMLNTALSDKNRYPLKPENFIVMSFGDRLPMTVDRSPLISDRRQYAIHGTPFNMAAPCGVSQEFAEATHTIVAIDPAGGGDNETSFTVGKFLNGNIFVPGIGANRGGWDEDRLDELAQSIAAWKPNEIVVEKNFGNGAFTKVFMPIMNRYHKTAFHEVWSSKQKDNRICDAIEPALGRGSIILHENLIVQDAELTMRYHPSERLLYSLFYQLMRIRRMKDSLVFDDRADSFALMIQRFIDLLLVDQKKIIEANEKRAFAKLNENPMGYHDYSPRFTRRKGKSVLDQYTWNK